MFSITIRVYSRVFIAAAACAALIAPVSARVEQNGSYTCPVRGQAIDAVTKDTEFSDYMGVRYYYCCEGCKPDFDKNQQKYLKANKGKIIGASFFDPITTRRIDPAKAQSHSDFNSVRYFFAKDDDKKSFDKEPKKYTIAPKKKVLFCPVSNEKVETYDKASDYSDLKGTRYYFCCAGCKPKFDKDPDKYLKDLDERMKGKQ